MKKMILGFLKDLILYVIILIILLLLASKAGWTDESIWDNVIGYTVAWIIWRLIAAIISKKKKSD